LRKTGKNPRPNTLSLSVDLWMFVSVMYLPPVFFICVPCLASFISLGYHDKIRLLGEFKATFVAHLYTVTQPSRLMVLCTQLRMSSLRPKVTSIQTHRICIPKALAIYYNTRSSVHITKTLTTPTTWVDRLPPKVQPYLYLTRIDKPIGTFLLFYPCSASLRHLFG